MKRNRTKPAHMMMFVLLVMAGMAISEEHAEHPGKGKTMVCAGCHGIDGNSAVNPLWPKLAEQQPSYTIRQLQAFQMGERKDPIMQGMVAALSLEDINDIAGYYAEQRITRKEENINQELFARGEQIFQGGLGGPGITACKGCHGPQGQGMPGGIFPALRGQHEEYLVKALNDFRSGTRTTDPEGMMRVIAERMTDDEIRAVAVYLSAKP